TALHTLSLHDALPIYSHAGLAYLSIMLFVIRFGLFYFAPHWRRNKLLKIVPHIIDTLLLVFAIMLCIQISQYPLTHHWLTAKVLALLAYRSEERRVGRGS